MYDNSQLMNQILQQMVAVNAQQLKPKSPEEIRQEKIQRALAAAGAAMTANTSPDALQGISQGITSGVQAYHGNGGNQLTPEQQQAHRMQMLSSMLGATNTVEDNRRAAAAQLSSQQNADRNFDLQSQRFEHQQNQDALETERETQAAAIKARKAETQAQLDALKQSGSRADRKLRAETLKSQKFRDLGLNDAAFMDDETREAAQTEYDEYVANVDRIVNEGNTGQSSSQSSRSERSTRFQEGQTATGPNGEKIVFRDGRWVRMVQ